MKTGSLTSGAVNLQTARQSSNMQTDPVSKNIQNRIANMREQLQTISADESMSAEDKMKKRQEIQREISNLNQQLRQHEIEQRKEQQAKKQPAEDFPKPRIKSGKRRSGLSQASMQAMISADSAMKQASVQGSVSSAMDGRAGVLKAEIKQDAGRDNSDKKAELAEVEQKSMDADASQMSTLADANKAVEAAAREDAENAEADGKTGKTDSKSAGKNKKAEKNDKKVQKSEIDAEHNDAKTAASDTETPNTQPTPKGTTGNTVDIRL